ncbi:MAG: RNA polymerase sigma factor [Planctomycetes bacterium]|nr:RNA polymerase sigma factor [Planctomycetota bacterium]
MASAAQFLHPLTLVASPVDVTLPMSTDELLRQTTWLQRLARRLVADPATADDLVQDTVTDALRQRPQGLRNLRAWLATVLQRRARRLRQRERQRSDIEQVAARAEAMAATDDTVATAMLHRDLVDAVLALAEPYRTTILLHYLRELPVAEVARRTGVPLATARSRVQRGLAHLRDRLDRCHGGRGGWAALVATPALAPALTTTILLMNAKHLTALVAAGLVVTTAWWWLVDPVVTPDQATIAGGEPTPRTATASLDGPGEAGTVREALPTQVAAPTASRVLATASGIALDEQTQLPVAGVEVSWQVARGDADTPPFRTRTDAAGRFVLECDERYPDNALNLLFVTAEHAQVQRAMFDVEGKPGPNGVPDFDVGVVLLAPGTGLQGRVVDAEGQGVADAELLFYDRYWYGTKGRAVMLGQPLAIGRTAADGWFAPRARVLPTQDAVLVAASPRGLGWLVLQDLTRSRSERRDLRIVLAPAAALQVDVVDRAGKPVVGAEIVAEPRFDPLGFAGRQSAGLARQPSFRALFVTPERSRRPGAAATPAGRR